uniref:Uncharacterized protein n=1 Tax=Vespula pensylvanica TaxID=30213 RepID=A0A834UG27_VESPE|nr:hypothetical protein H0235_000396 [Vespula pensylvanica]
MVEVSGCGELQQLVQEEECEEPLSRGGEATPPLTPARSQHPSKNETHSSHVSQQVLWESNTQTSPIVSKGSSGQATSQGSMVSGRAINFSNHATNQSRLIYLNEKEKQRPNRPEPPKLNRQQKDMTPCKHHCFLSEVPDVRRMEQALLQLLEDFHSGNLRAFGKDCSMEHMTEIREQQERLARLHFELGQRQEVGSDQSGLRQSSANMRHLLHRLQQLSVCIEKLHKLYEEPTTYKYDYVHHPLSLTEKTPTTAHVISPLKDAKHLDLSKQTVRAHDTLQYLSYDKQIPFNTFWESKDTTIISIKPSIRHKILGDHQYQEVIRSRPRVYMTPGISLDDIQNSKTRKLLVDFTYMTTSNYASKDVWGDFKPRHPCHTEINVEEICKESMQKPLCILSARFPTEAEKWDKLQDRSFLMNTTSNIDHIHSKSESEHLETKQNRLEVKRLLEKDKLRIAYDKLSPTYGGYRPYVGLGIPLEKKVLPIVHPDLSISQALRRRCLES